MNKEEFKKQICDIIDTMDDNECEELSLKLTLSDEKQDIAQELIKINGEFKKLTKVVSALSDKDKQNTNDIKPYIQMYKFLENAQNSIVNIPTLSMFNIGNFREHFGAFKSGFYTASTYYTDILQGIKLFTLANIGDKFDSERHEIVETTNDEKIEDEIIVEVIDQGFIYNDEIINYAKVKVNKI
ncbi:MAG: nucleotide exchange factor GrpE [Campylobacterota bacterium]|nr:nucleotide exchange factor GrpE [Campylobacterota bacterium]